MREIMALGKDATWEEFKMGVSLLIDYLGAGSGFGGYDEPYLLNKIKLELRGFNKLQHLWG